MIAGTPSIAVVIPIYKQGDTLAEAIESVLAQETSRSIRLVLVNDGCPTPLTDEVCRVYQWAHPGIVFYLRQTNRGLAGARNAGARAALSAWPSLTSLLFLDADDRICPGFLEPAVDLLGETNAGWIYPNVNVFGNDHGYFDMDGEYSTLRHLADNYCVATSLLSREVFDAGVWFDESLRSGWEDWDFWLQCLDAGFRGGHLKAPAFSYRIRPGSMLRSSASHKESVFRTIRGKHPRLFNPARFVDLEQNEKPRFALVNSSEQKVHLTTDPARLERSMPLETFADEMASASRLEHLDRMPAITVLVNGSVLERLRGRDLIHGLMWQCQIALDAADVIALNVGWTSHPDFGLRWNSWSGEIHGGSGFQFIALRSELLTRAPRGESALGLLRPNRPGTSCWSLTLADPDPPLDRGGSLEGDFSVLARTVAEAMDRRTGSLALGARPRAPSPPHRSSALSRSIFGAPAPFPITSSGGGIRIGWLIDQVPGPSRYVLGLAQAGQALGWRSHLFIDGMFGPDLPFASRGLFESVTLLRPESTTTSALFSLLGPMELVVTTSGSERIQGLYQLMDHGTRLLALDAPGASGSGTIAGVAKDELIQAESRLTGIVAFSKAARLALLARGVPDEKILLTACGPSTPLDETLHEDIRELKCARRPPLRLLLLHDDEDTWALDLRRSLLARLAELSAPVELLCAPHRSTTLRDLRDLIWSDIVVLAGRYSSDAAVVRTAQWARSIVITMAAPGMDECIEDGETGWLYPPTANAAETAAWICERLGHDADPTSRIQRMAGRAADGAASRDWREAAVELDGFMKAMKRP